MAAPTMPPQAQAEDAPQDEGRAQAIDPALCDRTDEDTKLQERQKAAWDAYYGRFPNSVETEAGGRNRNIKSNRAGPIVDKTYSWMAKLASIEVVDKDAPAVEAEKPKPLSNKSGGTAKVAKDDPRQQWIDRCLGSMDDFLTDLEMIVMSGSITGHAYVKINYDETKGAKGLARKPYSILDSQHTWVIPDPDDVNIAVVYVVEHETPLRILGAMGVAQSIVKRQIICRCARSGAPRFGPMDVNGTRPDGVGDYADDDYWTIATYMRLQAGTGGAATASRWKQLGEIITWDFPFPPIVDCMNLPVPNRYYGQPDLVPEIARHNERLNNVETDTATTLEQYSMPLPYATGYNAVEQVRMKPGSIMLLPQGATAGVMQPRGDIVGNRDFANDLRADMDERSRVPAVALGRQEALPKGNLSGVALELLFQPLVEKITAQRRLYGKLIRDLCLRLLVIADQASLDDTEIRLHWDNLLPRDDAATAQMVTALAGAGMSTHAICEILGRDYDEEMDYRMEEAQDKLNAAAKGQGMPLPPPMPMPPAAAPAQPGQPAQPPQQNLPPVNHPAAQAARATMQRAVGKGGAQ